MGHQQSHHNQSTFSTFPVGNLLFSPDIEADTDSIDTTQYEDLPVKDVEGHRIDERGFFSDISRRVSFSVHEAWNTPKTKLYVEYKTAFELNVLEQKWITHTKLLKYLKIISSKMRNDSLTSPTFSDDQKDEIIVSVIKKAYPESAEPREQRNSFLDCNIFSSLTHLCSQLGYRQAIFLYALQIIANNPDVSSDHIVSKLTEVCDRANRCGSAHRQAFNLVVFAACDDFRRIEYDLKTKEGALIRFYEFVEDFLDEHKYRAFITSFIEPARFYFDLVHNASDRDHVNIHGLNWYLALLESTLTSNVPIQSFLSDDCTLGVVDFWSGLSTDAWNEFAKESNFGLNFERVFRSNIHNSKFLKSSSLHSGEFPSGYRYNSAKLLGNAAIDPNCPDIRRKLAIYLERYNYFFRREYFIKRCFENLNAQDGFSACAETLFQLFKQERSIEAETIVEYCYQDDMFTTLDIDKTEQFFAWTRVVRGQGPSKKADNITEGANEFQECPMCMEMRSDVTVLEHLDRTVGDISSHAMCPSCLLIYPNKNECPFCKEAIKSSEMTESIVKFIDLVIQDQQNPNILAAIFEDWEIFELTEASNNVKVIARAASQILNDEKFVSRVMTGIRNKSEWFRDAAGIFFRFYVLYVDNQLTVSPMVGDSLSMVMDIILEPLERPQPVDYDSHFYGALYQQVLSVWLCAYNCDQNTSEAMIRLVQRVAYAIINCYEKLGRMKQRDMKVRIFERIHDSVIKLSHEVVWGGVDKDVIWKLRTT